MSIQLSCFLRVEAFNGTMLVKNGSDIELIW